MLVENYRPGALGRLGYGWDVLHARWPRLVLAAASGFGQTGPLRERPAFDMVAQAMGGVMSLTGYPDGPPARVGVSIGDIAAGLFLAIGVVAALHARRDTGEGTMVDVAMLDCQLAILENALTTHLVTGVLPGRLGPAIRTSLPSRPSRRLTGGRSSSARATTASSPSSARRWTAPI